MNVFDRDDLDYGRFNPGWMMMISFLNRGKAVKWVKLLAQPFGRQKL